MTTSLRHRKSKVFLRKFDTEIRLFHLEPCKIPKHKWSAYFASIFKRSKSKHDSNDTITNNTLHNNNIEQTISSKATVEEVEEVLDTKSEFDQYENIASSNEYKTYHHYAASLPSSPVSLSPPPKHTMIINRKSKSKSLMPIDITAFSKGDHSISKTFSSTPTLTINDKNEIPPSPSSPTSTTAATTVIQRQCLPTRSPILRLSLDFEHHHHHSRQSSVQSNEDNNENDYDYSIVTSSSSLLERRRQRNSLLWKNSGLLELDQSLQQQQQQYNIYEEETENDHNNKEIEDLITDFQKMDQEQLQQNDEHKLKSSLFNNNNNNNKNKNNQIGKDKAHYDAIVASTLSHHRTRDDCIQQQLRFLNNPLSSSISSSSISKSNNSACSSTIAPTIALNDKSNTSPPIIPIYFNDTDRHLTNNINDNSSIELLVTPPPSAQLIKPNLSLSPFPLSTNSMQSNEN